MDNFEHSTVVTQQLGSSPMRINTSQHRVSTQSNPTREILISRENDISPVEQSSSEHREKKRNSRNIADGLLDKSRKNGIHAAIVDLAQGKIRSEEREETQEDEEHEFENGLLKSGSTEHAKHDHSMIVRGENESNHSEKSVQRVNEAKKEEIVSYLSESIDDPHFTHHLGAVAQELIAEGKELDPQLLRNEAMKRYSSEKNSNLPIDMAAKVSAIEEEFADVLSQNAELRGEIQEFKQLLRAQADTMQAMALAILELARRLHQEKEEEEEKMTLLELMIRIMGLLLQEMAGGAQEKGKDDNQAAPKNSLRNIDISKIKLPAISLPKHRRADEEFEETQLQEDQEQLLPVS